jgi:hypothetical protein
MFYVTTYLSPWGFNIFVTPNQTACDCNKYRENSSNTKGRHI